MVALLLTLLIAEPGLIQKNGQDVAWSKGSLPLWVEISHDVAPWRELIESEIELWNRQLGFPALRVLTKPLTSFDRGSVVQIHLTAEPGKNPHTKLWYTDKGEMLLGMIFLSPVNNEFIQRRVIAHELGHLLGLDHDPDLPGSLMYPSAKQDWWSVTPNDLLILRNKYAPVSYQINLS